MLEAVKHLGELEGRNFITDLFPKGSGKDKTNQRQVLLIKFTAKGVYEKVDVEKYHANDPNRYYYRRKSSNGPNYSPTAIYLRKTKEGKCLCPLHTNLHSNTSKNKCSFHTRILPWFEENASRNKLIEKIRDEMRKKSHTIEEDIEKSKIGTSNSKEEWGITVFVGNKGVGGVKALKDVVDTIYQEELLKGNGRDGTCMVCGRSGVSIGASISEAFPFATREKRGFLPGFDQSNGWKAIPICSACADSIKRGKNFLDEYLDFQLFGGRKSVRFFIIPRFGPAPLEQERDFLQQVKDAVLEHRGKVGAEKLVEGLVNEEDHFVKTLSMGSAVGNLRWIYLFYEREPGSAKRTPLEMTDDVTPSWLGRMFKCRNFPARDSVWRFMFGDEDFLKAVFHPKYEVEKLQRMGTLFGELYPFFQGKTQYGDFERDMIFIMAAVLSQRKVSYDLMIRRFSQVSRKSFSEVQSGRTPSWTSWVNTTLKAVRLLVYLSHLNALKEKPGLNKVSKGEGDMVLSNEELLSVLVGAFVAKIRQAQYEERGATPFDRELYGLRINGDRLQVLFKKAKDKAINYAIEDRTAYLEEVIANLYLSHGKEGGRWQLSDDGTSFWFTVGLAIGRALNREKIDELRNGYTKNNTQ